MAAYGCFAGADVFAAGGRRRLAKLRVERGVHETGGARLRIQLSGFRQVFFNPASIREEMREAVLRHRISGLRRLAQQLHRAWNITLHANSIEASDGELHHRWRMAVIGGAPQPVRRFFFVLRNAFAALVENGKRIFRIGDIKRRGAAEVSDRLVEIRLSAVVLKRHFAEQMQRSRMLLRRRFFKVKAGGGAILRHIPAHQRRRAIAIGRLFAAGVGAAFIPLERLLGVDRNASALGV